MPWYHVPMGPRQYIYANRDIQLSLNCTARISSLYFNNLSQGGHIQLESLLDANAWITWNSNPKLDLNIFIRLEGCPDSHLRSEISTQIADIIRDSSLWSDLNVVPVFKCNGEVNIELNQLNSAFTIRKNLERSSKERPSKFPQCIRRMIDMNTHIQPPPGVPTFYISELDIAIEFSQEVPSVKPEAGIPNLRGFSFSKAFEKNECRPQAHYDGLYGSLGLYRPSLRKTLSSDELLPSPEPEEAWESLDEDTPFSSQESTATSNSSISQCQSPEKSQAANDTISESIHSYMPLLDYGFRSLICPSTPLSDIAIRTKSQEPKANLGLAEIAPTIFSPGYDAAVSGRACLILTIAKGLSMAIDRSKSEALKTRFATLKDQYRERCDAHSSYTRVNLADTTKMVLTYLLWNKMQGGLYTPSAARKLSPLCVPGQQSRTQNSAGVQYDEHHDEALLIDQDDIDPNWDFDLELEEDILIDESHGDKYGGMEEEDPFYDMLEISTPPNPEPPGQIWSSQPDTSEGIAHTLEGRFTTIVNQDQDQNSPYITPILSYSPMLDVERTGSPISNMSFGSEMDVLDDGSTTAFSDRIIGNDDDGDGHDGFALPVDDSDNEIEMLL